MMKHHSTLNQEYEVYWYHKEIFVYMSKIFFIFIFIIFILKNKISGKSIYLWDIIRYNWEKIFLYQIINDNAKLNDQMFSLFFEQSTACCLT